MSSESPNRQTCTVADHVDISVAQRPLDAPLYESGDVAHVSTLTPQQNADSERYEFSTTVLSVDTITGDDDDDDNDDYVEHVYLRYTDPDRFGDHRPIYRLVIDGEDNRLERLQSPKWPDRWFRASQKGILDLEKIER
jgi:hypothetical protein